MFEVGLCPKYNVTLSVSATASVDSSFLAPHDGVRYVTEIEMRLDVLLG